MDYLYDVFISYHHGYIDFWAHNIFLPTFKNSLENNLGHTPKVFIDRSGILAGDSWHKRVQSALAKSKCLVSLFQPSYFYESKWCFHEFSSILEREKMEGYRTEENPQGLITPICVGDGHYFPDYAKEIQWLDCAEYCTDCEAFKRTEKYLEFETKLRLWTPQVASVIQNAPAWKEEWSALCMANYSLPKRPSFPAPSM